MTQSLKGKTPVQAAGLTDHRWTVRELLTFSAAITSKITLEVSFRKFFEKVSGIGDCGEM
jgi:hypothetical protein